jgi:hypothetical protein
MFHGVLTHVLTGIFAPLKRPVSVRIFLWVFFVVFCAVARPAVLANMNNRKKYLRGLHSHPLPPKVRIETRKSRSGPRQFD